MNIHTIQLNNDFTASHGCCRHSAAVRRFLQQITARQKYINYSPALQCEQVAQPWQTARRVGNFKGVGQFEAKF